MPIWVKELELKLEQRIIPLGVLVDLHLINLEGFKGYSIDKWVWC